MHSERSREFLPDQVGKGGYMNHIKDILRQLGKQDSLEAACFLVSEGAAGACSNEERMDEDFFADLLAQACAT